MIPMEWLFVAAPIVVLIVVLIVGLQVRDYQRRQKEMSAIFNDIANQVLGGRSLKKPLVLDIGGQFSDNIHIESIGDDAIRKILQPSDRIPGGQENWMTDAETIAHHAFKRGHDALVLTNTADQRTVVVMALGGTHVLRKAGTAHEQAKGRDEAKPTISTGEWHQRIYILHKLLRDWAGSVNDATLVEQAAVVTGGVLSTRQIEYVNRKLAENGLDWTVDAGGRESFPRTHA